MSELVHPDPNAIAADVHLQRLLAAEVEEPWYKSFVQNLRDTISPPKLPPLELTSKPVAVKDIWGLYGRKRESGMMSLAIHGCVVLLMFTVLSNRTVQTKMKEAVHLVAPDLAPYMPELAPKPKTMQGGGGGGDRSPTPASKGRAPKLSPKQFVPPAAVVAHHEPRRRMRRQPVG